MTHFETDYLVIGGGSGGVRSARIAAGHGADVVLVEGQELGGTCVHRGCIPKKLMGYAASFGTALSEAEGMGWNVDKPQHDWVTLRQNVATELARLDGIYEGLLRDSGVTTVKGWARFIDPYTVQVGADTYQAKNILIAVGGKPKTMAIPGGALALSSDNLFTMPVLPPTLAVLGGGYIGLEMATIFAGLGTQVTLIHRDYAPLRGFDSDIRKKVLAALEETPNLVVQMNTHVEALQQADRQVIVRTDKSEQAFDGVLAAVGRAPHIEGLGLDKAGVETDRDGHIVVDEQFRSNQKHIYAVGDVSSRYQLTPIAIMEGHCVADQLFGKECRTPIREEDIPTAVFCHPPVAVVGYTEDKAKAENRAVTIYESAFRPLKSRITGKTGQTYMKLIVDSTTDKVIGLHMLGTDTPEILQGFAAAITAGVTKKQLDATLALHPTAAEELVLMRKARAS